MPTIPILEEPDTRHHMLTLGVAKGLALVKVHLEWEAQWLVTLVVRQVSQAAKDPHKFCR